MTLSCKVIDGLDSVPVDDWNRLNHRQNPFLDHAFLRAFEHSECAHPHRGWQPQHLLCYRENTLVGALPLYLKTDSYGEFVFDWAWAEAYARAGLNYYPKLISAIPFTPATGARLLMSADDYEVKQALQRAAIDLAQRLKVSSLHILFPEQDEANAWREQGLLQRTDCQFHWQNKHYATFADFLATFTAKRRKEAKRERRIANSAVEIKMFRGQQITPEYLDIAFEFYQNHAHEKGGVAYLNRACFEQWAAHCPEKLLVFFAYQGEVIVACAFFIVGESALYGRYWGVKGHYSCLHFELCYYRPIEYCIEQGLARFEAGAQGEHKLGRGLTPQSTHSCHWIAHPEFRRAIQNYLNHETQGVSQYMQHAETLTPQKKS